MTSRTQSEQIVREVVIQAVPEIISKECFCGKRIKKGEVGYDDCDAFIGNIKEDFEERPIRLADVLLAIGEKYGNHVLEFSGTKTCSLEAARIIPQWNLRADSLSEQSDETVHFLAELFSKGE